MQIFEQELEMRAIRTLTDDDIPLKVRSTLLGKLGKDHFHTPFASAAFRRIDTLARKKFEIIGFPALVADPTIDEDLRDILRKQGKKIKPCSKKKELRELHSTLDHYRKIRAVHKMAENALKALEKPDIDADLLLSELTTQVSKANIQSVEDEFFLNFGKNDTSNDIVEEILTKQTINRLPTGYNAYDRRNGGLPQKGVFIISATTSGGKSTLAMNLGVHFYLHENRSVCRISLEMDETQETRRLASHLTKIEFNKFKDGKLSMAEKSRVRVKFKEFREHGQKHDIVYTTVSPKTEMTIDDVFRMIKPYRYQVIMIDYIGLLAGMDSDKQWYQLSEIARVAKAFSRETGCLVCILAQLDDTSDNLRYSRGIKEHADTMWKWNYTKPEQRETRILPIRVDKDRDGEVFSFDLAERYDIMTAENMPDEANSYSEPDDEVEEEKPKGKKRKGKKKRPRDDDDSEPSSYALS